MFTRRYIIRYLYRNNHSVNQSLWPFPWLNGSFFACKQSRATVSRNSDFDWPISEWQGILMCNQENLYPLYCLKITIDLRFSILWLWDKLTDMLIDWQIQWIWSARFKRLLALVFSSKPIKMSPCFVLGRENVPCVAEVVNRLLKADCTDFISQLTTYPLFNYF